MDTDSGETNDDVAFAGPVAWAVVLTFVVSIFLGFSLVRLFISYARTMVRVSAGFVPAGLVVLGAIFGLPSLWIIGLICALIVFLLRKRLAFAADVMAVSAHFVGEAYGVMWFCLKVVIVSSVASILIVLSGVLFYFNGEAQVSDEGDIVWSLSTLGIVGIILCIFLYYWLFFFFQYLRSFAIGGTVTSWYFHRGHDDKYNRTTLYEFRKLGTGKQLGTVAAGSFISAVVEMIKTLAEADRDNGAAQCVSCLLRCIASWIEWINGYAMCFAASVGTDFRTSTQLTFQMFGSDGLSAVSVDFFFSLTIFVMALFSVVILGVFGYGMVTLIGGDDISTQAVSIGTGWSAIVGLVVVLFMLNVFEDVVTGMFIAYVIEKTSGYTGTSTSEDTAEVKGVLANAYDNNKSKTAKKHSSR